MRMTLFPSQAIERSDVRHFFLAACSGMVSCTLLYTLFGFIFVHVHARRIAAEMGLFLAHRLTPVIMPDNIYLVSLVHQLGSGMFFGLTLGLLSAILASVVSLFLWLSSGGNRIPKPFSIVLYAALSTGAIIIGYSRELPAVSILFGILAPAAYFVPWTAIVRNTLPRKVHWARWVVFAVVLLMPLVLLKGQSYELIRDALVDTPVLRELNTFYYEHTLLAADVIKPVAFRTQNAITLAEDMSVIGRRPHGTLWIIAGDPCGIKGAVLVASRLPTACRSVRQAWPAVIADKILKDPLGDRNKPMRKGIGTFFRGPILLIPVLLLAWIALLCADLSARSMPLAVGIIILYLAAFAPAFSHMYLRHQLYAHPEKIHAFASSSSEAQRHLALVYLLDEKRQSAEGLSQSELFALAKDPHARIRLNALMLTGKGEDKAYFFALVENALADPQLNVRTKACWALGEIGGQDALDLLKQVLSTDRSWYVRDYAYNAIGRIQPITLVVKE